jgi:hypothetical protein
MAREISDVVKELQSALTNVQKTRNELTAAEKDMQAKAVAHRESQEGASALRLELNSIFDGLVPVDQNGRVRSSQ